MQIGVIKLEETRELFFEDTALIGIACALQPHQLCWLLNRRLDIDFERADRIIYQERKGEKKYYPVHTCFNSLFNAAYTLYTLKSEAEPLIPEIKQLDYLWMLQSATFEHDAEIIIRKLKLQDQITAAMIVDRDNLKNIDCLLV